MADIDVTRDYRLTDSELTMYCSNLCNFLTRDLSDFAPIGLTAPKIAELKALGDELEVFPTDGSLVGDVMVATEDKNALREQVLATIRAMALRVEQKWGANSGKYRRLDLRTPSHLNDDGVLTTARTVHTKVSEYLADLAEFGLTQAMLDDFEDLSENFEKARNAQSDAVANRDVKRVERINKGNELYKLITFYCNYGKMIYEKTNPAKYDDYLIYKDSAPGTLLAPQNLVFNYSAKVLWWDIVDNAVSYQLQWFNGTDYEEIYAGDADNFAFTPPDGLNKFRVRAHNSGGYGPFSDVLEQYYFAVLPKAANLQVVQSGTIPTEGELTWNAVPTAVSYKIYQSVDNLGEYAAHWLVVGTVTEPLKSVTLTLGKRNSFKIEPNNSYQTSMSEVVYIEV